MVFRGDEQHLFVIQQQLEHIYSQPFDPSFDAIEASLLVELHELWKRDKLHYKQRSHIQWL